MKTIIIYIFLVFAKEYYFKIELICNLVASLEIINLSIKENNIHVLGKKDLNSQKSTSPKNENKNVEKAIKKEEKTPTPNEEWESF